MKRIESRNNPTIKLMNSLSSRSEREAKRLFYFEGVHLLEEYLRSGNTPNMLFVREDALPKYEKLINCADCEITAVISSVYDKLTEEKAPQGIFTVSEFLSNVKVLDESLMNDISGNSIFLVDLQDTGNVGTVIRTAAAMDCNIVLCGKCADVYSAKTVRATMGALFMGNIFVSESAENAISLARKSGKRVIATALTDKAEVLGNFNINSDDCFLVGNEGQGLSDGVIEKCDMTAIIPMSGKTESLNAAVASAMLLWEAKRGKM